MKKTITLSFLMLALLFGNQTTSKAQTATQPSNYSESGAGTASNPYKIGTLANLYWIADQTDNGVANSDNASYAAFTGKYFIQTADIDASATATWFPNGSGGYYGWLPIGYTDMVSGGNYWNFGGNYNGQGHKISGLYVSRPDFQCVGFIGSQLGGKVENLGVTNVTAVGQINVGGLLGYIYEGVTVENCFSTGNITATGYNAGGLVGNNEGQFMDGDNVINKCYSACNVSAPSLAGGLIGISTSSTLNLSRVNLCFATGKVTVTSSTDSGGLIGSNSVQVTNCYAAGIISAEDVAGGLIGTNSGIITNCYVNSSVSTSSSRLTFGGLVGDNVGGTYNNCFWNKDLCTVVNASGTGETTSELQTQSTYSGWTFDANNWGYTAGKNNNYPYLTWQTLFSSTLTTTVSAASTTSANLGGNITDIGNANVTERGIVYSSSNATPIIGGTGVTKMTNGSGSGSFSSSVSSLIFGTKYYVQSYATNSMGTSYGGVQAFAINTISSIVRSSTATTNASSVSWTVTYAASLTGLTSTNFSLANTGLTSPSITGVTGSGTTWTVTASTGSGSGSLGLNLINSTGSSTAFTNTLPFAGEVYTIDKIVPTVTLSSTASEPTNVSPIPVTITFSESVTGFTASDIAVTNGTLGSLSGSGASYSINVTPSGQGAVTVNIAAGVASDAAGNSNTAATQLSRSYITAPGVLTIGTATAGNTQASVAFTAPASNGGSAITGYTVTSSPGGLTGTGTTSPITVTGLTNGTAYTFTITATNVAGTSAASVASNSVIPVASQTITFANPGAQNFGTTPTLSASSTSGLSVTFSTRTPDVCSITSGGILTFKKTGTCTILADQAGNTAYTAAATVSQSFTVNAVVPNAPTIGTATSGDTQASVSFTAPIFNGGSDVTGYTVTSSPGGLTGTGTTSPLTVTGLTNGTAYTFTITATNVAGTSAASVASNSVIPVASQTITFANPGAQNFGTTPTLSASSTSGLSVTFSTTTPDVCSITSGGIMTFIKAGTCTILANQAGNAAYTAAQTIYQTFTVNAVAPDAAIIGTATAGDTQAMVSFTAPAFSGGSAITGYTVTSSPGNFTGTGITSPITVAGLSNGTAYTFTVTATNSAGTSTASAASNSVTPNMSQTITFANPGAQTFGTSPSLSATATSGLAVTFTTSTPDVCSITSGGIMTFIKAGTCTILANQAGNAAYTAAQTVSQTFTVNAVAPDAPIIGTATAGDTQAMVSFTAPAFSGGSAITGYTVTSSPGNFTGTGITSPITVAGLSNGTAYTFTVTATNSAGASTASVVSNSVTPNMSQTITFDALPTKTYGDVDYNLTATSNSGLTVSFSSDNTSVASVSGTTVTIVGTGTANITASQAGNTAYVAATNVIQQLIVNKKTLSVTATADTKTYNATTVSMVAPSVGALAAGDALNVAPTQVFDNASVGTTHVLTASGLTIKKGSTDVTGNYDISYATANGSITAKPLTITAPTVTLSKVYDGNSVAAVTAGLLSGVVASDAGNVTITASASYDNINVGTNKTITVVYTLSGSAAENYSAPANFVATGAEIASGAITLEPLSNPTPSATNTGLVLSYSVVAGGPTQYKMTFETAALAVGFQNVSYTALATTGTDGSITIIVPKGTRPGKYKGTLQMQNEHGIESTVYAFVMTVNIPTEYIAVKYNRVLVLDNSTKIFSTYQWYKDGVAIEGATKQFYRDPNGLVGTYSIQATTTDGEVLYSYPKVLNIPLIQKVTAYPSLVRANQTCTVEITDEAMELDLKGAELSVYSSQGIRVFYSTKVENLNTIKLPTMDGVYSGRVTTADGQSFLFKVIVAN